MNYNQIISDIFKMNFHEETYMFRHGSWYIWTPLYEAFQHIDANEVPDPVKNKLYKDFMEKVNG